MPAFAFFCTKRLAGKNVFEKTYFYVELDLKPISTITNFLEAAVTVGVLKTVFDEHCAHSNEDIHLMFRIMYLLKYVGQKQLFDYNRQVYSSGLKWAQFIT